MGISDPSRLDEALAKVRATSPPVTFTPHYTSYTIHPDLPSSTPKSEWYLEKIHNSNPAAQEAYQANMSARFAPYGITLSFSGDIGNTLPAHRVIQYFQGSKGEETAGKILDGMYRRYHCEAKHPAGDEALIEACVEAGIPEEEAKDVVGDKDKGLRDVEQEIRSVGMDVDAVPVVVVEGKRRDITLTGAKEVDAYVKALETVIKESS